MYCWDAKQVSDVSDEAQPLVLSPSIESPSARAQAQAPGSSEVLEVSEEEEEEIDLNSLPEVRVYDTNQLRQIRQNYGL